MILKLYENSLSSPCHKEVVEANCLPHCALPHLLLLVRPFPGLTLVLQPPLLLTRDPVSLSNPLKILSLKNSESQKQYHMISLLCGV